MFLTLLVQTNRRFSSNLWVDYIFFINLCGIQRSDGYITKNDIKTVKIIKKNIENW